MTLQENKKQAFRLVHGDSDYAVVWRRGNEAKEEGTAFVFGCQTRLIGELSSCMIALSRARPCKKRGRSLLGD